MVLNKSEWSFNRYYVVKKDENADIHKDGINSSLRAHVFLTGIYV
jgi:hypothetical protein